MRQGDHVQSLMLPVALDLREEIGAARVSAFQLGPNGDLYLALVPPTGASRRLRLLGFRGAEKELDIEFLAPPFETHLVQPLGENILLACSRCGCGNLGSGVCAAGLYDRQGKFLRPMNLGEGIANLQTSAGGQIWTGYLYEGDFGGVFWQRPEAQPGLAAFSAEAEILKAFDAPIELGPMEDCYALNLTSDRDLWFIHYPSLALVHLRDGETEGRWDLPLAGGCTLAIAPNIAMYRSDDDPRDQFQVVALCKTGDIKKLGSLRFMDETGHSLAAARSTARGGELALLCDGRVYRHDLPSGAAALTLT